MEYDGMNQLDGYKPLPRFESTCCEHCVYFDGKEKGTCPAYPKGIPDKFAVRNDFGNMAVHYKVEEDQVGTTLFDVIVRKHCCPLKISESSLKLL